MNRQRHLLSPDGFTLIELMVVICILGILASVAIPKYQKFQNRARQVEAKLALSSIYVAETSWYGVNQSFSFCLYQLGYIPSAGGRRHYFTGFKNGGNALTCGPNGDTTCYAYTFMRAPTDVECSYVYPGFAWEGGTRNDCTFDANAVANPAAFAVASFNLLSFGVSRASFKAGAWASFDAGSDRVDIWTIDENKSLVHLDDGT